MLGRLILELGDYDEERYGVRSGKHALRFRRLLSLHTADRPIDRARVGADVRRDRFQHVSAGYI